MAKITVFCREKNEAKVFRQKKMQMQKKKKHNPCIMQILHLSGRACALGSPLMSSGVEERLLILLG